MRSKYYCLITAVCFTLCFLPLQAQTKGSTNVWLTTADRSSLFEPQKESLRFGKPTGEGQIIEVDDSTSFQTIDGFGFALTGGSAQLLMRMDSASRNALLKELFATGGSAIGVSYLRVSIGSSDMNDHVFTYDDLPPGATDPDLAKFNPGPDRDDVIPVLKEILAINPAIKILGSPWSAPSWMKTNDNPKAGGLKKEYYPTYAQYFVKYIQTMKSQGIAIDAVTIQNEPLNGNNTPSMVVPAQEEAAFIAQALGPAFRKAGITTKIILYDHNCDVPDYPLTILKDPEANQFTDGSGFHLYGGEITAMSKVHDAYPTKNLYFTEQMVVEHEGDPQLKLASPVNRLIIGATRNWSRNVLLWNLAADPKYGPHTDNGGCPVCQGAITLDGSKVTRNIAFYTVAHASKFVRPGSVRVQSDTSDSLPNVAFKTPQGQKVLIVVNAADTEQTFSIRYHGKDAKTNLKPGAVATYLWQ